MGSFVTIILVVLCASAGVWAGSKVAKFSGQRRVTNLEMWRLGAQGGPTARDREIAQRHLVSETAMWERFGFFEAWFFRLVGAVLGGTAGLVVVQSVGVPT